MKRDLSRARTARRLESSRSSPSAAATAAEGKDE